MRSMNRVFLMGHLGNVPELTISKNGKAYCRLSIATNSGWLNPDDQWETKTDWHSVFVWGPTAENCVHSLRRGSLVFVEGALTYWKVAQKKEYQNAIHGHEVKFLSLPKPKGVDPELEAATNSPETSMDMENLDNPSPPRNHNAVAHPA